ncbi:MAG: hypothetical protein M1829_005217 [Trizodia sp. TS-e1964]|nr:MAG: hypothetical protein M1829_005217 [Trizodia sp. TS-e1964]
MASATVSTPLKSHHGIFSTRTAGGRMPLTPSPRTRTASLASNNVLSTPFTPPKQTTTTEGTRAPSQSIYKGNLSSYFTKQASKTAHRESPKSNIARPANSPRRLELGISDWSLTGTGPSQKQSPSKEKSRTHGALRSRPVKSTLRIAHNAPDRFIPNRTASEGIANPGSSKIDMDGKRPKTSSGEGSTVLANAASAYDIGGRVDTDDALAALEGLNLNDNDEPISYSRPSPTSVAFQSSLADACGVKPAQKYYQFMKPAPVPSKSVSTKPAADYCRPLHPAKSANRRRILTAPERVLDAPGLVDDYYLNLLDWSAGNQVAIGLERSVYVWSAETGTVSCLLETPADTYVTSVKWDNEGSYVGIGLDTGEVQIWDVEESTKVRSMFGHQSRVGVMGWNKHILSTGARSGLVYNHDVRIAQHKIAELVSHTAEVCGLEWQRTGAQLATGGNDNLVSIWDARSLAAPKFRKTNHRAAVKALSWQPETNILATGGGSYDRHIHFWNTTTGARVNSIDTGSQVTSLRWNKDYKEIVSTSGFPDNSLSIWSYPHLTRTVEIPAHETRVLHSCLSPDGQMLATAAADESLKFWKLFEKKSGSTTEMDGRIGGKAPGSVGAVDGGPTNDERVYDGPFGPFNSVPEFHKALQLGLEGKSRLKELDAMEERREYACQMIHGDRAFRTMLA